MFCLPGVTNYRRFLLGGGSHILIPFSELGLLPGLTWPRRGLGACELVSVSVLSGEEDTIPWESPTLLDFTIFLSPFPSRSLGDLREGFDEDVTFRPECAKAPD